MTRSIVVGPGRYDFQAVNSLSNWVKTRIGLADTSGYLSSASLITASFNSSLCLVSTCLQLFLDPDCSTMAGLVARAPVHSLWR